MHWDTLSASEMGLQWEYYFKDDRWQLIFVICKKERNYLWSGEDVGIADYGGKKIGFETKVQISKSVTRVRLEWVTCLSMTQWHSFFIDWSSYWINTGVKNYDSVTVTSFHFKALNNIQKPHLLRTERVSEISSLADLPMHFRIIRCWSGHFNQLFMVPKREWQDKKVIAMEDMIKWVGWPIVCMNMLAIRPSNAIRDLCSLQSAMKDRIGNLTR
jgi:hypothetical protein